MIKDEDKINHLLCFSVVKTSFEDHILEDLCGMLSLPWIHPHSDDGSLKLTTFATNLLALSQRISDSYCKSSQNSVCVVNSSLCGTPNKLLFFSIIKRGSTFLRIQKEVRLLKSNRLNRLQDLHIQLCSATLFSKDAIPVYIPLSRI